MPEHNEGMNAIPMDALVIARQLDQWTNVQPGGAAERLLGAIEEHGPGVMITPVESEQALRAAVLQRADYLLVVGPVVPISLAIPQLTYTQDGAVELATLGGGDMGDSSQRLRIWFTPDGRVWDVGIWAVAQEQLQELGLVLQRDRVGGGGGRR